MITSVLNFFRSLALAFSYRFRGGGWITSTDVVCRSVWAASLAVIFLTYQLAWWQTLCVFVGAYCSMQFIPHAFAQNMGRGTTTWSAQGLKKYWPGAWLPQFTQEQYSALTIFWKACFDFFGMMSVGIIRGILVFGAASLVSYFLGSSAASTAIHFAEALFVLSWGCPLSYLLLWYVPWSLPSLSGKSTEWPEFGCGLVWGAAMIVYCS